jgi:hypothetical protein
MKGMAVSLIEQILGGSLLSNERLMQAREGYAPSRIELDAEAGYARWTERLAAQRDLDSARELAGLADEELKGLEAEFVRCPTRRRADRLRLAMPAGATLMLLGAVALVLAALGNGDVALVKGLGIAFVVAGVTAVGIGAFAAFSVLHLEVAHGTLGLYVGMLDEQHPWLYKAMRLCRHPAADEYRQRVLRERGALRGVDCVVMREIVRAQEVMEDTQPARSVAEQLQSLPPRVELATAPEPRLVRVATRSSNRPQRVTNQVPN